MTKSLTVRLVVDGKYRDIWLYKNRIYLWDRIGQLFFLSIDDALKHVARSYGHAVTNLVQTLIFRNDWKVGEQLQSMLKIPEISVGFLRPFSKTEVIELSIPIDLFRLNNSETYAGPVLDSSIYANRLYLGTPHGLLESYLNPDHPDTPYGLDVQADFRASRLAVRSAAINASAEEEGLFFARVILSSPNDPMPGFKPAKWMRIADYSLAVTHANKNILNYTGDAVPSLFQARTEKLVPHENARYEDRQVIGYDAPLDLSNIAYSALNFSSKSHRKGRNEDAELTEQIQVLGNSESHLLTLWHQKLRVLGLRASEGRAPDARVSHGYRQAELSDVDPELVLETYPINRGFVVELSDSLRLITQDGSYSLMDGRVARVRTFTNSIRHKEVIATVEEDSVSMIGFFIAEETIWLALNLQAGNATG
jgi:hypothetical protein